MDDYYTLLGVDHDASTDDIRSAYRERKAALDSTDGDSKADAAQLNKAWNVLSDPYQRGRYDQQRVDDADDVSDDDDDAADAPAARRNGRSSSGSTTADPPARKGRQPRQPLEPTIEPPAGYHYPPSKQRIIAMVIDLGVLVVFVLLGTAVLVPAVAKSQKPAVVHEIDRLNKVVDQKNAARDAAKKDLDAAKKVTPPVQVNVDAAQKNYDTANKAATDAQDAVTKEGQKLFGVSVVVMGFVFLVGLVYLIVPSLKNGQTLGKRIQHLRVVREDGSNARFTDLLRRYGPIVLVSFVLVITPIGFIGGALILFGVLRWMRNRNFQGIHDRFAHTLVVAED